LLDINQEVRCQRSDDSGHAPNCDGEHRGRLANHSEPVGEEP
jgi:hypothetical protein